VVSLTVVPLVDADGVDPDDALSRALEVPESHAQRSRDSLPVKIAVLHDKDGKFAIALVTPSPRERSKLNMLLQGRVLVGGVDSNEVLSGLKLGFKIWQVTTP
jgi:hypothetical protein